MSEWAYIDWLRRQTPTDPRVVLGPGDDAAVVRIGESQLCVVTTDMLLEGSCFLFSDESEPKGDRAASMAFRVGRKAMAASLSDVAAMASLPIAAVVSLAVPRHGGQELAEEIYRGLRQRADEFDTAIVGGDTNSWQGPVAINVTLLAQPTGSGPVTRSGAEAGDWLFVTGPLGGSIAGKHLDFRPRVREAARLHQVVKLKAMIDISDGLAIDLHHICRESGCGAVVRDRDVPISETARQMNDRQSPLEHALSDGEDFELLFAVSPTEGEWLSQHQPLDEYGVTVYPIGQCVPAGVWLEDDAGRRRPLAPEGFEHRFD